MFPSWDPHDFGLPRMNRVVALIPLRGGSKGIPRKNIKILAGKPLCAWVLEAACRTSRIDEVYVSTDCEEIANVVKRLELGIKVVDRPPQFATDEASTESAMIHFMENVDFEFLVTIQATSPTLRSRDLDCAIERMSRENLDSLLTAVRVKRFFWSDDAEPLNYDPLNRPRRQEFAGTLVENGAFYITSRHILQSTACRLGGKIGIYEMDEGSYLEIDELDDFRRVEEYLRASS